MLIQSTCTAFQVLINESTSFHNFVMIDIKTLVYFKSSLMQKVLKATCLSLIIPQKEIRKHSKGYPVQHCNNPLTISTFLLLEIYMVYM